MTKIEEAEKPTEIHSVHELVTIATKYCLGTEKDPLVVAIEVLSRSKLPRTALVALAQVGLASQIRDRIRAGQKSKVVGRQRGAYVKLDPKEVERLTEKAKQEETHRRAALYNRVLNALDLKHRGADGKERSLLHFTVEDHHHRRAFVLSEADSMNKHAEFHKQAVAALSGAGVATIAELDPVERARLAGMLA